MFEAETVCLTTDHIPLIDNNALRQREFQGNVAV